MVTLDGLLWWLPLARVSALAAHWVLQVFQHLNEGCKFGLAGNSELTGMGSGKTRKVYGRQLFWLFAIAFVLFLQTNISAIAETRTIAFRNMHTNETMTVIYKRNGQYIPDAMRQINQVLRDWRRNESIRMNPKLIDLAYEVHRATGSTEPINVVSGYRSPVTNAALRRRSRGVARNSQHILGNAMDIYIPDVTVKKIREVALRFQRGGVGYYPSSRRPFVHIDVGSVRHWPRMSPQQLAQVFPDGNTMHIPTGGKPLPRTAPSTTIQVASASAVPERTVTATAPAPARRQEVARPTPGVDPLIVASVSPDASIPLNSGSIVNPLELLGIGGTRSSSTQTQIAQSQADQPPATQQEEARASAFDIALVPLPDLRPVQLASLDTENDASPEQQPFAIAGSIPMPTTRPEFARTQTSGIALAYGEADTQPSPDRSSFDLASVADNNTPFPSLRGDQSIYSQLDSDLLASLIEDELAYEELSDIALGIWTDDLDYGYPVSRDLVSPERAESQAFAQLLAPQLTNLRELSVAPRYSLAISFTRGSRVNTVPDQFDGPAVQPLRYASAG